LAHLVKGLDLEEASLSLLLFALLVGTRRRFDAPGDPLALVPLGLTVAALGLATTPLSLHEFGLLQLPERVSELLWTLTVLLSALSLQLWLRPWRERRRSSAAEYARARKIIATDGADSLDFFALRGNKSYFFSTGGRAFVAYRVVAGCALIGGDPVGDEAEFQELLTSFRAFVRSRGWRIGVLAASDVDHVRVLHEQQLTCQLRVELEDVSTQWRGNAPERGFAMTMDRLFGDNETVFVIASGADGRIGGFLHLVPSADERDYSLSAMRRRPATPNGLMEYLVSALSWMHDSKLDELSLNFCVFADILRADHASRAAIRGLKLVMLGLDRVFQLDRLLHFNSKFFPEWRPRYLMVERLTDFPRVGLACLLAESLLVPPGRWNRSPDEPAAV
jgi:lysyl-tRNA synthetase, class II